MAASTTTARRYAEALFSAARAEEQIDAIERDLTSVDDALRSAPQLLEMMRNPLLPAERKNHILDQLFSGTVHVVTLRFLRLLVEKRRSEVLPQVHGIYREIANDYRGIVPAHVTSAVPLTPAEEEALVQRLTAMTGKTISLRTEVRPNLIGGVRVRVGDTVIDGTVVGYLRQLRERLRESIV